MRVLVLGGDGYLGWPTAMHLSNVGYDVAVVDSYLRRKLSEKTNCKPLIDMPKLSRRCTRWRDESGFSILQYIGDLRNWEFMMTVFRKFQPEAVVHYAEQPSAPYSMLDRGAAMLTLENNLQVTMNLVFAVKEICPYAHIVKLGTMGEYGTPNIDIEEGWLEVKHKGREHTFLYPREAGSLYHTTKIMDTDLLWFYCRTWNICVTDLMQGPVYGLFTGENQRIDELLSHFNYDEIFGTVLNRFIAQVVADIPLTVYGKGGQARGYIDIRDTVNCIRLAIQNPPEAGELKILNQFVDVFTVNELAERVMKTGRAMGYHVKTQTIRNPRKELEEHYYNPSNSGLLELGLEPHHLTDDTIAELIDWTSEHRRNLDKESIIRGVRWS